MNQIPAKLIIRSDSNRSDCFRIIVASTYVSMHPRHWPYLYFFMMVAPGAVAQSTSREPCCIDHPPRWLVKLAPLSIIDPDNTIQFGVERALGGRYSLQIEAGYGWQGIGFWDTSRGGLYSHRETWRGRAEWRIYLVPESTLLGPYIAIEGLYKRVSALEQTVDGIPCLQTPCVPGITGNAPVSKHVWGSHLKLGYQYAVSSENRLVIDLYGGLGIRHRQTSRPELPTGVVLTEPPSLFGRIPAFPVAPAISPSISLGVKVGYAF